MDAELKDQIWLALPPVPLDDEAARFTRIDERLQHVMTASQRRRMHRLLVPFVAALILAIAVTAAIAGGQLDNWFGPDKPAGRMHVLHDPPTLRGSMLQAFLNPAGTDDSESITSHMVGSMSQHLEQTSQGERLLGRRYYRQLLDWTDPQERHHEMVAIPTSAGGVCIFSTTEKVSHPREGSGGASCTVRLDTDHPIGASGYGGGNDLDVTGVAADEVTAIEVVQRNGRHSQATLGTNAYWWTAHTPWNSRGHRAEFPAYMNVTTRDGRTRKFTLLGVPYDEAMATAKAVRASRAAKCKEWGVQAHTLGVCGYRADGSRLSDLRAHP